MSGDPGSEHGERVRRPSPTIHEALAACLDWIANLELTFGNEVLVDHMPNGMPSRWQMAAMLGERRERVLPYVRCHACGQTWPKAGGTEAAVPDHPCAVERRMFAKQVAAKLRADGFPRLT